MTILCIYIIIIVMAEKFDSLKADEAALTTADNVQRDRETIAAATRAPKVEAMSRLSSAACFVGRCLEYMPAAVFFGAPRTRR